LRHGVEGAGGGEGADRVMVEGEGAEGGFVGCAFG
jgi:hypothetical protein